MNVKIFVALFLSVVFIAGCSVRGGSSGTRDNYGLSDANIDGNNFPPVADAVISNTMSIEGCPKGFVPADTKIKIGVSASLEQKNGKADSQQAASGNRNHECVAE